MADKRHKCFDMLDAELKPHNTRLVVNMLNNADVFIWTERIQNLRDGKQAKKVVAAFCPFCGKKLKRKDAFNA
jgi:hypothetical protein